MRRGDCGEQQQPRMRVTPPLGTPLAYAASALCAGAQSSRYPCCMAASVIDESCLRLLRARCLLTSTGVADGNRFECHTTHATMRMPRNSNQTAPGAADRNDQLVVSDIWRPPPIVGLTRAGSASGTRPRAVPAQTGAGSTAQRCLWLRWVPPVLVHCTLEATLPLRSREKASRENKALASSGWRGPHTRWRGRHHRHPRNESADPAFSLQLRRRSKDTTAPISGKGPQATTGLCRGFAEGTENSGAAHRRSGNLACEGLSGMRRGQASGLGFPMGQGQMFCSYGFGHLGRGAPAVESGMVLPSPACPGSVNDGCSTTDPRGKVRPEMRRKVRHPGVARKLFPDALGRGREHVRSCLLGLVNTARGPGWCR